MTTPRRFHHSRIAALAFAGVFVVCAVVMGVVFSMSRSDDIDASTFQSNTDGFVTDMAAGLTRTVSGVGAHFWPQPINSFTTSFNQEQIRFARFDHLTNTVQPLVGQVFTRVQDTIGHADWGPASNRLRINATFPGNYRIERHPMISMNAPLPGGGVNVLANTGGATGGTSTVTVLTQTWRNGGQMSGEDGFWAWWLGSVSVSGMFGDFTNTGQNVTSASFTLIGGTYVLVPVTNTVTFDSQGGSGVPPQNVRLNQPVVRPSNPFLSNFTFAHWSATINGPEWNFNTPIAAHNTINATNTLFAVWRANSVVSFNTHGGGFVPQQTIAYRGTVTRPADPSLANHTFRHWSATQNGTTAFNFATLITSETTINATNTLHAVWWVNPTITFNTHGGSPTPPQQRPAHGGLITEPAQPTRSGWHFRHWSATLDGAVPWNFATQTVTANQTLHAVWDEMVWRTITMHVGNPLIDSSLTMTLFKHQGFEMDFRNYIPGHVDLVFRGWALSATQARNHDIQFYPTDVMTVPSWNMNLHAVWDIDWDSLNPGDSGHNRLVFHFSGGANPNSQIVEERPFFAWNSTSLILPTHEYMHAFATGNPDFNGLTFIGWFDSPSLNGQPIFRIPNTSEGRMYFYAKWIDINGITVIQHN
ncbi:MAG: InlB B-repeat-containing protein [Firmicutes bacterium]|nr:InlB B-repeat-containing protein [Bacillota bacterium]